MQENASFDCAKTGFKPSVAYGRDVLPTICSSSVMYSCIEVLCTGEGNREKNRPHVTTFIL